MWIVLKQLKAHYQKVTLHNELQICKFVLYENFHQTLKHLVGWNIPKFVRICVFWNMTILTLTLILCLFTNTIFEWILLHLTSMTKHIYKILIELFWKAKEDFFSTRCLVNDHGLIDGRCLTDWSWDFMFMNQMFVDVWVFDD
jgi:hypothetical protein